MIEMFEAGEVLCRRYMLKERLGSRGKSGYAMAAMDQLLDEEVVCKIAIDADAYSRNEFVVQYRKLRQIRTDDVVDVLGYAEHVEDERVFPVVVMERVHGIDIDSWEKSKPTPKERVEAMARVAAGLSKLHASGVAHGDLGAGNILVSGSRVVLIDPEPELWGSPVDAKQESLVDSASLTALLNRFLADIGEARSLLGLLGSRVVTSAEVVAAELWRLAMSRFVPDLSVDAFLRSGLRFQAEREAAAEAFVRNREHRLLAITRLRDMIQEEAAHFGIAVEYFEDSATALEAAADGQALGRFVARQFVVPNPRDARVRWVIDVKGCEGFKKPVPFPDQPEVLSGGRACLEGAAARGSFELQLQLVEGIPRWLQLGDDRVQQAEIDRDWIRERIVELASV